VTPSNLAVILAVDLAQIVACRRRSGGNQIKSWMPQISAFPAAVIGMHHAAAMAVA